MVRVALLAPGEMGSAVAGLLLGAGHEVRTVLTGRSARTVERARAGGIVPVGDLGELLGWAQVVLSIVPPATALPLARQCANAGLDADTVYADLNAIAPATVETIRNILAPSRAAFVDGGIIGPAPRARDDARVYLSGPPAPALDALHDALDLRRVGTEPGLASALKLCFAASTKAVSALHLTLLAAAQRAGVGDALLAEFALSQPALVGRLRDGLPTIPARAARWVREMEELAGLLAGLALPDGAARAAAQVYARAATLPWAGSAPDDVSARPEMAALVAAFLEAPG